ncbi:glycosyltransferase [Vibrio parahaemolyticus]|uniref:N-acetylgalactosamine-N, N'-diacetylbacillosaminyl-diphospho-undecaprenol 4-alpha-N-acetylgalactosaminyltransferase n=1 Tax=Vibrio parahaemolyticus TaxID=670 RepID=A0A7M1VN06_VIBPH|nr:glycosyltransferase [Vibrio parahaemolyticus]EGR1141527.1 glycosyltransferase [Vibrio parahaemolyticus]ELB1647697.1 glycosyltransferase [Vibrio parahaemolyticus]KYY50746.1 hypothetical protein AWQ17_09265 [Vibrio parahaemolyticus]QOS16401.1 N-acetylgalactosamine-N,N'-diacetylbacillosaminyl-diphospho-undecaprenol 4-alpha-N-acetylgalactosaminyltransferase [Vibrio parahaemolyticus]
MKILLIRQSLHGGGAERVVVSLANKMTEQGHDVTIYITDDIIEYDLHEEVTVVKSSLSEKTKNIESKMISKLGNLAFSITSLFHVFSLRKDLKLNEYDKIYIHSISSLLRFQYLFKKNVYAVYHASKSDLLLKNRNKLQKIKNIFALKMSSLGKGIVCVSEGIRFDLEECFGICNAKVIYNPFDLDMIRNQAEINYDNVDIAKFGSYILNVGRLQYQKNQEQLIKAFFHVSDKFDSLLLLGVGPDDKNLKKLVISYGLEERVFFLGYTSNPYFYMKHATVFVLSSRFEGFGNVLVEALACNCPVISSNCNYGPNEIMINSLSYWLYNQEDTQELTEKLTEFDSEKYRISDSDLIRFSDDISVMKYLNN